MRLSELRALKWSDLDTDNKSIKVSRQIERKSGGGFKYKAPKTRSGLRSIELGAKTMEALDTQKFKQRMQVKTAQEMWFDHDLMFTTAFGNPYQENQIRSEFYKLLEIARLPKIRFHNLRHTAASIMLNNGVPPIVVSKRLGHSSVTITLDTYGHLIPEMQSGIGDMLDELVSPVEITNAPKCTKLHQ
jgi:integrase